MRGFESRHPSLMKNSIMMRFFFFFEIVVKPAVVAVAYKFFIKDIYVFNACEQCCSVLFERCDSVSCHAARHSSLGDSGRDFCYKTSVTGGWDYVIFTKR